MRVLRDSLLWLIGIAVAFGATEIVLRVASIFDLDTRYLATAGTERMPRAFGSLEDFLAEYGVYLVPHTIWNNHYANALGFTDREFPVEKPPGTRRIMAIGDSSLYGMVAYPQNVQTLVEDALRRDCRDVDTEIMNFGVPTAGPWEYRWLHKLAAPRYKPDVVTVHFYTGNDGPELFFGRSELPVALTGTSYAWNYLSNSIKLLRSVRHPRSSAEATPTVAAKLDRARKGLDPLPAVGANRAGGARGGERASERPEFSDRDFLPVFTEEVIAWILKTEAGRLYRGKNRIPSGVDPWKTTLEVLDMLAAEVVASTGRGPIIILYPSQLQIYPDLFEKTKSVVAKEFLDVDPGDFDPMFPNRILSDWCRRSGLSCLDVTPAVIEAAKASPEPLYIPRDGHYNIRGNAVVAAAEAAFLRQELCPAR